MAVVRKSLNEIRAGRPTYDADTIAGTSEQDIARQMLEDGQSPDHAPDGFEAVLHPRDVRRRLGFTQEEFARRLGIPVATIRNWEQGRVRLDPAVRSLLTIVDKAPEAAFEALASAGG